MSMLSPNNPTSSLSTLAMSSLAITELRTTLPSHSVSAPSSPASWMQQYSPVLGTASLPCLSPPVAVHAGQSSAEPKRGIPGSFTPVPAAQLSPGFLQSPLEPYCSSLQSTTTQDLVTAGSSPSALNSAVLPQSPSLLQIPSEGRAPSPSRFNPPPPSPAVSLALITPSPAGSDLMLQEFHHLSLRMMSPGFSAVPSSLRSLNSSRHSLRSVSTRSASRQGSPSSAAALSSSITQPVSQSMYADKRPAYLTQRSSTSSQVARRPHHSLFYMRDEMVTFSVEDCLYRVHRHHLERDSEYFRRLFLSRSAEDGRTDETAIPLPGVLQHEFDCLLHFLYYRVYDTDTVSLNEWVLLLGISTQLRFVKIRQYAIREISMQRSALSPVETIVLATTHDVPEWLASAFADLSRRSHPLDDLEAEQLGAQLAARIGRAREALRDETFRMFQRRRYGNRCAVPDSYDDEVVDRVVLEVFWPGAAPAQGL